MDAGGQKPVVPNPARKFRLDLCVTPASPWQVTCSVRKQFRANTASQSQVSLHKASALLIQAATCLVYAFATMTRRSTGLLLFASEVRGEAHFGEPCSWWQSSELQLMSKLGSSQRGILHMRDCQEMGSHTIEQSGVHGRVVKLSPACLLCRRLAAASTKRESTWVHSAQSVLAAHNTSQSRVRELPLQPFTPRCARNS